MKAVLISIRPKWVEKIVSGEKTTEEQKKRIEAIDMMKHIAAEWDIDAKEVFGKADE